MSLSEEAGSVNDGGTVSKITQHAAYHCAVNADPPLNPRFKMGCCLVKSRSRRNGARSWSVCSRIEAGESCRYW